VDRERAREPQAARRGDRERRGARAEGARLGRRRAVPRRRQGRGLQSRSSADDAFDLPLVTGVAADKIVADREGVEAKLRDALALVDDVTRSELAKRHPLQEVHLEKDGTVLVVVGSEAIALHLGRPPYKGKLEQASRVLEEIGKRKAQASMVFLDNDASPERVVVRMR
jgi:cell division protein FtsQ